MPMLPRDWRCTIVGAAIATMALAGSAHAAATSSSRGVAARSQGGSHAGSHGGAAHSAPSAGFAVHPVSFASKRFGPVMFKGPMSRQEFTLRGARLSLHDAVYYHSSYKSPLSKTGKARYGVRGRSYGYGFAFGGGEGSLQCVPFARAASGIELKGNAANWWEAAAGVYERGSRPEPGSVLNFRATGHMRLGHVAVVAAVIDGREIEIDHANWAGAGAYKGGVARGVHVVDVSPDNDWSEVRVALGNGGDFGSTYPTYGFIYDRPDRPTLTARHVGYRLPTEVAEAPRR